MVLYEVTVDVEAAIALEYRAWLAEHVRELLALPGFLSAEVFDVETEAETLECETLVVCYRLASHAALSDYLRQHAPRMRAQGVARFGRRFRATRRILHPIIELLAAEEGSGSALAEQKGASGGGIEGQELTP